MIYDLIDDLAVTEPDTFEVSKYEFLAEAEGMRAFRENRTASWVP